MPLYGISEALGSQANFPKNVEGGGGLLKPKMGTLRVGETVHNLSGASKIFWTQLEHGSGQVWRFGAQICGCEYL